MHDGARAFIERKVKELGPFNTVLEIGSRDINGTVREFFPGADYFGIDKVGGSGVDYVIDALTWQTAVRFDCIVATEVFEHEPKWPLLVGKISTWLAPDGVALLTMAGPGREPHSAVDGSSLRAGEPYENVTPDDLVNTARIHSLHAEVFEENHGDLYAVLR